MKENRLFFILVIMALLVVTVPLPHSGAYFSDMQTEAVTITTGEWWTEADSLVVHTDDAKLVGSNYTAHTRLHSIRLENSGEHDITIDQITVSWNLEGSDGGGHNISIDKVAGNWTADGADGAKIRVVNIGAWGEVEWSGQEASGSTLDIADYSLSPGEKPHITFVFDKKMTGKTFAIVFIMGDESSREVSVDPVQTGGSAPSDDETVLNEEATSGLETAPDPETAEANGTGNYTAEEPKAAGDASTTGDVAGNWSAEEPRAGGDDNTTETE